MRPSARARSEWRLGQPSTSRLLVLEADESDERGEPLRRSRLVVTQVGSGSIPIPAIELLLDVALLDQQTIAPLPTDESGDDLYSFLVAALSTVLSLEQPLRGLLGAPPYWEGPWGFLTTTDTSLGEKIIDPRFQRHSGHAGLGASLDTPALGLNEVPPKVIVNQWMKRMMLDLGFVDFEPILDELGKSPKQALSPPRESTLD